jgi:hypothetical protein
VNNDDIIDRVDDQLRAISPEQELRIVMAEAARPFIGSLVDPTTMKSLERMLTKAVHTYFGSAPGLLRRFLHYKEIAITPGTDFELELTHDFGGGGANAAVKVRVNLNQYLCP